jgi:hypothetical protein
MHTATAETMYEDVKGLLINKSKIYAAKHRLEFEEVLAEANWAFCYAMETFNGTGTFIGYLCFILHKKFTDILRHKYKHRMEPLPIEINKEISSLWSDILLSVSKDAQDIMGALKDTPNDILCNSHSVKRNSRSILQRSIREYFVDLGWTRNRVQKAMQELREALL